jgi:hypothetical protein
MNPVDWVMLGGLAGTWVGAIYFGRRQAKRIESLAEDLETARSLIEAETERKSAHTRAFEVLSNPELIEQEMEKSARATEMRIARRTTLPREDAGPPAKVYRPKIHKRYPKSWPK